MRLGLAARTVAGLIGVLALTLLLFQPLSVGNVTYSFDPPDSAVISFDLTNHLPGSLRISRVTVPLDSTAGVAFDHRPVVSNEEDLPLIGYQIRGRQTAEVTLPITVTGPGNVAELRVEYRVLGIPKTRIVPIYRVSL